MRKIHSLKYGNEFAWYDSNGQETVDTGLSISVDSFSNGEYTITISQN